MGTKNMPCPVFDSWKFENLRLTAFTPEVLASNLADNWWKEHTGTEAESISSKPALGFYSVEGRIDNARLQIVVNPGRVDWLMTPEASPENPFPDLGTYEQNEDRFLKRVISWSNSLNFLVSRLAFGLVVRNPAADRISAYKTLASMLHSVNIDAEGSTDFMYQINRARQSNVVPGLTVNRLGKWHAIVMGIVNTTTFKKAGQEEHYARIEIDVNTMKNSDLDLAKSAPRLINELLGLSKEIIEKGDIA